MTAAVELRERGAVFIDMPRLVTDLAVPVRPEGVGSEAAAVPRPVACSH
jgi:hypothetical protein